MTRWIILLLVGAGAVFYGCPAHAMRVTLKRVVFEGPKRSEVLTLLNNTDRETTYRLGWQQMAMTADGLHVIGKNESLPESIQPVDEMVRYSPRRITLPPGESQQIRLMLRTPAGLPDGEYRSHFWITPEADVKPFVAADKKQPADQSGATDISISMLTGLTLPVIVRKGPLQANISLTGLRAHKDKEGIRVDAVLERQGNKSTYGNLKYYCEKGEGDKLLREVRGIAVYPELSARPVSYVVAGDCPSIRLDYRELSDIAGEEGALYASGKARVLP